MSYKNNGYEIKANAIPTDLANFLYNYLLLKREVANVVNTQTSLLGGWTDTQVPDTYSHYADIAMETLLAKMLPIVEKIVGTKLLPQYTFLRIYKKGDILKKHKDRSACEISTTMFLGGDEWKIYMEGKAIDLKPGDMCVYKGCELEHWRNKFKGKDCVQVFLHYITKTKTSIRYDNRDMLGLPAEWSYD
tara:strand:+ start:1598 stop:2167 length:570 start_codon:yes stop_codon:yes gene_type:complete